MSGSRSTDVNVTHEDSNGFKHEASTSRKVGFSPLPTRDRERDAWQEKVLQTKNQHQIRSNKAGFL